MDDPVIRTQDGVKCIHLSEISVLLLESTAISLTAYLLCERNRHRINVIFCDEKRCPYGMLASLYGSHDTSLKYKKQAAWDRSVRDFAWAEIVRAKIKGQASLFSEEKTTVIDEDLCIF